MGAWLIFVKERLPLPAYLLLSSGLALSGASINPTWSGLMALVAFLLVFLFFAELRLMDELKDLRKDRIANPTRPLPRGLLKPEQVARAIGLLIALMTSASFFLIFYYSVEAGLLYGVVTWYLWLMYREFYIGSWLEEKTLLYAISHQIILIPLVLFTVSMHSGGSLLHRGPLLQSALGWAIMVLGAFFTFEVCRKLDPNAHPILKTYRHLYGTLRTGLLVTLLSLLSALGGLWFAFSEGANFFDLLSVLVPLLTPALYFSFLQKSFSEKAHKFVKGMATLALAFQIWFPFLARIIA